MSELATTNYTRFAIMAIFGGLVVKGALIYIRSLSNETVEQRSLQCGRSTSVLHTRSPLEDENENLQASLAIEISDLNKLKRERGS